MNYVSAPVRGIVADADKESFDILLGLKETVGVTIGPHIYYSPHRFRVLRFGGTVDGTTYPVTPNFDVLLALAMQSLASGDHVQIITSEFDAQDGLSSTGIR